MAKTLFTLHNYAGMQRISLPENATIDPYVRVVTFVGPRQEYFRVFATHDGGPVEDRFFYVVKAGNQPPLAAEFIATCLSPWDAWHIYEET